MTKINMEKIKKEDVAHLASFDCGNHSINQQVKESYDFVASLRGISYKFTYNGILLGYCMLQIKHLYEVDVDPKNRTELEGSFGAIYLRYFAVEKSLQHRGIGKCILQIIVKYIRELSNEIPIRFFFLDALPDVVGFYKNIGFESCKTNKTLLYLDLLTEEMISEYEHFCTLQYS